MNNDILKNCKKVAIMGGTFNPIHFGHLILAQNIKEMFQIDKIIFIPTGNSPHKNTLLNAEHRYNMTKLAIEDNDDFLISDIEISKKEKCYTIDTLKQIKSMLNKEATLYFITGTDSINQINTWKEYEKLFDYASFIAVERLGYKINEDLLKNDKIHFCKTQYIQISSTDIRERLYNNKNVSYLLPKNVLKYILENNLYKCDYFNKYDSYVQKLKLNLNEKRFNHSLEVAKEAKKLANNYNIDEEKAFLAGLLHDCAKCFSIEQIQKTAMDNNYTLDAVVKIQPELAHSFLGYFVAKNEYNIKDEDILNAIKYHTTGKKDMSMLEKIIYIADYIEPTRTYFKELDMARFLAYQDLNKAMAYILQNVIILNKSKNRLIHPLSIEAFEFYDK